MLAAYPTYKTKKTFLRRKRGFGEAQESQPSSCFTTQARIFNLRWMSQPHTQYKILTNLQCSIPEISGLHTLSWIHWTVHVRLISSHFSSCDDPLRVQHPRLITLYSQPMHRLPSRFPRDGIDREADRYRIILERRARLMFYRTCYYVVRLPDIRCKSKVSVAGRGNIFEFLWRTTIRYRP